MSEINQHLEGFIERGLNQLKQRRDVAFMKVKEELNRLNKAIEEEKDKMAIADWESSFVAPSATVVPALLKYGDLHMQTDAYDRKIPFLLPTAVNAVLFDVDDDAERVPLLFQNFILRMLLSMPTNLIKVSIVDKDYGNSFRFISNLTNPLFRKEVVDRDDEIAKLISDLAKEVSEANREFLGKFADIDAFNAQAGQMSHPYHFVFIDDFPKGFSPQAIDGLLNLIERGNALKAGVKIFINYYKKNPSPRDFDLKRFKSICSCIAKIGESLFLLNWSLQFPSNVTPVLEMKLPENANKLAEFINGIEQKTVCYSLDGWIDELKSTGKVWSGDSTNGISVPVGFVGPTAHFNFEMACGNKDFFALITGQPGCGKSVLLKNIIVNAAMKYSPEELCFYLADFSSGGVTFSIFEKLPHVKALMMADNREYVVRMFQDMLKETDNRSDLFQDAQNEHYGSEVNNLAAYRKVTGIIMPRIVLVIDEFQVLFQGIDNTSNTARELLSRAIREWRKFGISVILSTQTLAGVKFDRDVDDNITYRFAMMEEGDVSKATIGNDAAKYLTQSGQTIMNNSRGDVNKNVEFQSAYSENYILQVEYLAERFRKDYKKEHVPYLCKRGITADIATNQFLVDMLKEPRINHHYCSVFIGKPDLLRREHTRVLYARQPNSHTLIIGNDNKTLLYDIAVQLIQLKQQSHPNSKFYIVDCFYYGDKFKGMLDSLSDLSDSFVLRQSADMENVAQELNEELIRRKELQRERRMVEERIVLVILNAQNCDLLKPVQDRFTRPSTSSQMLSAILSEGSSLGIHCIVHAFSYSSLFKSSGILENKELEHFNNFIALKDADTDNLILRNSMWSKVSVKTAGRVIVDNGELDGEPYEQCSVYSKCMLKDHNDYSDNINNLFKKIRDVK